MRGAIQKAMRDAALVFMAAGKYTGRPRTHDYTSIRTWRAENGASIRATAEQFDIGTATVKRGCAEVR